MKIIQTPSPNYNERPSDGGVDSIIIHYTDMVSAKAALAWLINPDSRVSAHYLIDEGGQIYQIVNEEHRAWHAGESYWQGRTNLNDYSVGIELANPGHSHGYTPFPEAQIDALMALCLGIKDRWSIPSNRILGHSDIAPGRKQDPGHLFPWEQLAQEGLGMWYGEEGESLGRAQHIKSGEVRNVPLLRHSREGGNPGVVESMISWVPDSRFALSGMTLEDGLLRPDDSGLAMTTDAIATLSTIGYDITSPHHALLAFQRHFQPHKVDGIADEETYVLLKKII